MQIACSEIQTWKRQGYIFTLFLIWEAYWTSVKRTFKNNGNQIFPNIFHHKLLPYGDQFLFFVASWNLCCRMSLWKKARFKPTRICLVLATLLRSRTFSRSLLIQHSGPLGFPRKRPLAPHYSGVMNVNQITCVVFVTFVVFFEYCVFPWRLLFTNRKFRVAVISAKNHKRQRRKRQSVTTKRAEKSQTPKVLTAILTLPNLT